jgi:dihydrolipoamide dehydrogenase
MYDAIVIGGGPSGIAAAARIGQLKGKVALVEKEFLGGVCTNWGCIPTKAMIASAKIVFESKDSEKFGVRTTALPDFEKVIALRDNEIRKSRDVNMEILKTHGVELIQGTGSIFDKNTVEVDGKKYSAKNIILCTGSKTSYPPFVKLNDKVITSREMTTIRKKPKRLVIMGGGVIGDEFATIFRNLGSDVTIIEMADRLMALEDPEIGDVLRQEFEKNGIKVMLGTAVKEIDDRFVVAGESKIPYDYVLVATGRRPFFDEEMLNRLKIKFDRTGVVTDDRLQTSVKNIYCIGDTTGKSILAHVGVRQGIVAANNIMGRKDKMGKVIPRCVYTIPEIACCGKTQAESKDPKTATVYFKDNARSLLEHKTVGFIKVILEKKRLVGVQMIGHNVTEIINEASIIIENNIDLRKVIDTIHPHPTVSETFKYALQKAMGELVEVP